MKTIQRYAGLLVGGCSGAIAGFLYWYTIGCESGACAIQSSWVASTLYGIFFGGSLGDFLHNLFQKYSQSTTS